MILPILTLVVLSILLICALAWRRRHGYPLSRLQQVWATVPGQWAGEGISRGVISDLA